MNEPDNYQAASFPEDQFNVEQLLEDVIAMVSDARSARSSLRSNSVILNRSEILELLTKAREKFPEEIQAARWLIKERKIFIEKVQQEKTEILQVAQKRAAELVSRVEVVRQAQLQAHSIMQSAREEAARIKHQMDHYCEKQLAQLEQIFGKIHGEVQVGRAKLHAVASENLDNQAELNFDQPVVNMADTYRQAEAASSDASASNLGGLQQMADPNSEAHRSESYEDPLLA